MVKASIGAHASCACGALVSLPVAGFLMQTTVGNQETTASRLRFNSKFRHNFFAGNAWALASI